MPSQNDPAAADERKFLENHDTLKAGLDKPEVVALNISAEDKALILSDNTTGHSLKSVSDQANVVALEATANKNNGFTVIRKNYRAIRQRILKNSGCTKAIAELLGLDGTEAQSEGEMAAEDPKPVLRCKAPVGGGIQIKATKGDAEAVNVYRKRENETEFKFLKQVLHFPWLDPVEPLVSGKPEKIQYQAVFVSHDAEYGVASDTVTVVLPG
ncbi:MAG: hypothetical protein NT105_15740 [Verrucomicrobia bacterium]|nr:hypothetical protein [Verrucomicrobiota bacterium]